MSDEIRVAKSTLVALEANDVEALPVAVFTRGFVVQFARILNLEERRIVDSYMKFFRSKRS
jgi:cytoskeletal protein RodZ